MPGAIQASGEGVVQRSNRSVVVLWLGWPSQDAANGPVNAVNRLTEGKLGEGQNHMTSKSTVLS